MAGHDPLDEDTRIAPTSPYARSKAAAEVACARDDLDIVVVRPFPHTGPGQTEQFAIPSFAGQIARIEAGDAPPVLKVGNLTAQRDYTDVRCVVDAYARLLETRGGPRVLNVASGTARSLRSILYLLLALATRPIAVENDPSRMRPSDIPVLVGSTRRLADATGWRPTRSLDETLADVLDCRTRGSGYRVSDNDGRRALITGITGQDGSYLAELLLGEGYEVSGIVRRSSTESFERIAHLEGRIELLQADLLDQMSLQEAVRTSSRPHEVYNLAAQSFVPTSWEQPVLTGRVHRRRA